MKKMIKIFLLCIALSVLCFAEEYAVIANKKMKTLSVEQIKAIFLKKLTFIDNIQVVPINLSVRDPMRRHFENKILQMNFQRLKSYWSKQHYLGHRPPINMKSEESAISFVKKVEGALTYVNVKHLDKSVNIIYRWRD